MSMKKMLAVPFAALVAGIAMIVTTGYAVAVPIVGAPESAETVGESGTSHVRIVITPGNPDLADNEPAGQVSNIEIDLDTLSGIDPHNSADLAKVRNTSLDRIEKWAQGERYSALTNSQGEAVFSDLPDAVYIVHSTAPDDGQSYREVEPFVLAIPMNSGIHEAITDDGLIITKTKSDTPPSTPPIPPQEKTPPAAPPEQPDTPQRGDLSRTGVEVAGIIAAGTLLVIAGMLVYSFGTRTKIQGR